ncbi:ABC transporter ATP-binding protein [Roseibium denhamense]|uniref:ATP-binding cassette, subfamily B, multidrug efflux pump n=1 Tax=Roseibium denhamense TaxID=76305 RepID=A0ABY1PLY4_9HYPH|nr:ABC transporter ATP-binding protein [Roseibium denhamense]MTI04222.1 ABC transporter ATP-binding protein [Roseibium denhamense]SMP36868.1 ATP-binding cassette, subfamily B, multidrug efflux pump [Roseibium denhamense]
MPLARQFWATVLDRYFKPFETHLKPLDLPVTPLPADGPVRLILHFARMFRTQLITISVLAMISSALGLTGIWAIAYVVDGVTSQGAVPFLEGHVWFLVAIFAAFVVLDPIVFLLRQTFAFQTARILLPAAMRWQAHKAVEQQDIAFFEDTFAGQVASRIGQVTMSVHRQMMLAIETIPFLVIQFAGAFFLLLALAWPLAIPVFVWIAANCAIAWAAIPTYMQRSQKVAAANSRATGAMTDVYSNIQMVKLFAAEDSEAGAIRKVIGETIDTRHSENRAYILTDSLVYTSNVLLMFAVIAIGFWGLTRGLVSIGDFVAGITVTRSLAAASSSFIGVGQSITSTLGTIKDAMPIMTSRPQIKDKATAAALPGVQGEIRFDKVSFTYQEDREPVLTNFDLSIRAGERVGLVGLSGAGKSTVIALLMRLRDVSGGRVLIDGVDIRDVTQASLRRQIGVVTQDIALLNRSIRDNIRYGNPSASDDEIRTVAEAAQAWEFICDQKDSKGRTGLDAHVGDRGVKLSGGQRQRITIARVLLKDAPVLILDEATSALDSEAEQAIQQNLSAMMAGRTTLAVAHRLSTIAAMDRLVVMDKGDIVEEGPHRELLTRGGLYARLWDRQSGGFLAADAAE